MYVVQIRPVAPYAYPKSRRACVSQITPCNTRDNLNTKGSMKCDTNHPCHTQPFLTSCACRLCQIVSG